MASTFPRIEGGGGGGSDDEGNIEVVIGDIELPIVTDTTFDSTGNIVRYSDQCGNTASDRVGTLAITFDVKAIVFKEQVQALHEARLRGDKLQVVSPTYSGSLSITDLKIKQTNKQNKLVTDSKEGEPFGVQIQLERGGGVEDDSE